MDSFELLITSLKIIVIFVTVVHVVPIMIWVERKGAALIQDRPGPNRVGIFGLLQPVADALKFIFKEDPIPDSVNKFLYCMGPFLSLLPATLVIAAIPMGDFFQIGDKIYKIQVADLDVGVLYMLAIGSLGIYGILFGGWASNNKFSLVGSLRAASQMVSYEVPLGLAAVGAVLVFGSFSLREMTQMQEDAQISAMDADDQEDAQISAMVMGTNKMLHLEAKPMRMHYFSSNTPKCRQMTRS
jgi:NADH-quinone oxidoreductase subunit H